jgi:hypothetical protein
MTKAKTCPTCGFAPVRRAKTCPACETPLAGLSPLPVPGPLPENWVAEETAHGIVDVERGSRSAARFTRDASTGESDDGETLFLW